MNAAKMNAGKALIAAAAAAVLSACLFLEDRVAGGGIETGNTGSLTGRVLNEAGAPVPNASLILTEVKLTEAGPVSMTQRIAETDDSGRYHFDTMPEGRYAIYAEYAPGDGRLAGLITRIHVRRDELELSDMTARGTVTLVGRVLPVPGTNVMETSVCIPGLGLCAHPGADSIYRIPLCPLGSYEAVTLSGRSAQYLALDVRPSNCGAAGSCDTAYIRDIALGETAENGRRPYRFYPDNLDHSFSGLPVAYPQNVEPSWYAGKGFDSVRYFILDDGEPPKAALPADFLAQWRYHSTLQNGSVADIPELGAPLAGFPVPIRLQSPGFDFSQSAVDGSDLAISDGRGRLLPVEIESWDAAAGAAVIWARLDTLAAKSADRGLTLHWGRSISLPLSQGSSVFRAENGYVGVWHLGERGDGVKVLDARGAFPGFLMTMGNTEPAKVRSGAGVLGGGYALDTSTSLINVRRLPGLDATQAFTLSIWAKGLSASPVREQVLVSKGRPEAREWHFSIQASGILELEFGNTMGGIQGNVYSQLPIAALDQWHHYAATYDRGTIVLYVDGKEALQRLNQGSIPLEVNRAEADIFIGGDPVPGGPWKGNVDEFEYLSEAKSADWISAVYSSQRPPTTP